MQHKHIVGWIAGGIVVAAILIYFAVSNGVVITPFAEKLGIGSQGGAPSQAPLGVSYNQADLNPAVTSTPVVVTGAPEVPGQSVPIPEAQIPKSAIKISVERSGFTPATFTVRAGEIAVVSITSADNRSHTFVFDTPALSSVAVGVAPHETRVITFTAPRAGTYRFTDNVFGATAAGTMVVK